MKTTLATIKKFIKQNKENLFIKNYRTYTDQDGDSYHNNDFRKAEKEDNEYNNNSLGLKGAWFVFHSRDYFTNFETEKMTGYNISNCCGSFVLAIKKALI